MTAAIGTVVAASLSTRDTVDCDTPEARAMSCIVTMRPAASSLCASRLCSFVPTVGHLVLARSAVILPRRARVFAFA